MDSARLSQPEAQYIEHSQPQQLIGSADNQVNSHTHGQRYEVEMPLLSNQAPTRGQKSEVPLAQLVQEEIMRTPEFTLAPCIPIELMFKNVAIWAETTQGKPFNKTKTSKLILKSISGQFLPGSCTAILGSSGSGKTTLLNYLSSRMEESTLKVNGELFINGHLVPSIQPIKQRTGYVTQIDTVMHDLTPREHFSNTAKMIGISDWEKKVNDTLTSLGLHGAADTRIGDDEHRGISGGERKRTSVGIELITDPSLLFLDEPTTGLDSKSALDVAMLLKQLAQHGRTIITTIHCPSAEILENFDRVLCLCYGEVIYDGPPKNIPSYFSNLGFAPPPLTNPADHLMTIIHEDDIRIQFMNSGQTIDDGQIKELFQQRINTFVRTVKKNVPEPQPIKDKPAPYSKIVEKTDRVNRVKNFFTVFKRNYLVYFRSPAILQTKIIQSIGFAFFALILFQNKADPGANTAKAISDIGGLCFFVAGAQAFAGQHANVWTILLDIPIFKRETQSKLYGAGTFYITHAIFEWPLQIIITNLFLLPIFFGTWLRHDSFWVYIQWLIAFLAIRFSASGLGDWAILIFKNIEAFNQGSSAMFLPLFLVAGFLANVKTIAIYMIVYSYLSYFRFGFQASVQIELDDDTVEHFKRSCRLLTACADPNNPDCYTSYGSYPDHMQPAACNPLNVYDFYETRFVYNILILIAQGIFFRIFAMIFAYQMIRQRKDLHVDLPADLTQQIASRKALLFSQGTEIVQPQLVQPVNLPQEPARKSFTNGISHQAEAPIPVMVARAASDNDRA